MKHKLFLLLWLALRAPPPAGPAAGGDPVAPDAEAPAPTAKAKKAAGPIAWPAEVPRGGAPSPINTDESAVSGR